MWSKSRTTSLRFQRYLSLHAKKEAAYQGFRTSESSALNHTQNNLAQFYKLDEAVRKNVFTHGGLPTSFVKQTQTFTETCVMVREPALEIIDLIKKSDLSKPVNRFVLYGDLGTGKSLTLAHLIQYAYESGFLLVHVPWVPDWLRRTALTKEVSNSATREGFVEIPLDAAEWLVHFKLQNQVHLKKPELKVSKEYIWSKREVTPAGASLLELIDHGINRIKYSNEVIVALIDEIKVLSNQGLCKTFVAVDGFNCFYHPETRLKIETRKKIPPEYVTLTLAFKELTKNDWCNAVTVLTVDKVAVPIDHQESYYPRYLLTKEGFEHLDPFIPIEVKNYNDKEFASCTDYYRDRLWLREGPDTVKELSANSAKNPYNLMKLCAPL